MQQVITHHANKTCHRGHSLWSCHHCHPHCPKPNIVLIFVGNFGYGEIGCYDGRTRGNATLWIVKLATGYSTWNFVH